ncbi:MAG: hypothetical protein OEY14_19065 [Myxococcales bacterium]|nr:hypothetical protein [Myxococcales bacterium]
MRRAGVSPMIRARSLVGLLALTLLLGGCAIFAGKGDYRAYRRVELAGTERDRLEAMAEYMREHPGGRWATTIQARRVELEPRVYEAARSSLEGHELYLQVFPDGPHAAEIGSRIEALRTVARRRQEESVMAAEVQRERREAALEQRRTWASRSVTFWARILLGVTNWGRPIGEVAGANAEFSRAFGQDPRPRCSREECVKLYSLDFSVPVPGRTRLDRSIRIMLRLRMREGNLFRAELLMPNRGFSRWHELEQSVPVMDDDPEARNAAIQWAASKLLPIVRQMGSAEPIDVVPEPVDPPSIRFEEPSAAGAAASGAAAEAAAEGGAEASAAEDSYILPMTVEALQTATVRMVIFAASPDDTGQAYDGLYIEMIPPEEGAEAIE